MQCACATVYEGLHFAQCVTSLLSSQYLHEYSVSSLSFVVGGSLLYAQSSNYVLVVLLFSAYVNVGSAHVVNSKIDKMYRPSSSGHCCQAAVVRPLPSGRHRQAVVVRPSSSGRRRQAVVFRPLSSSRRSQACQAISIVFRRQIKFQAMNFSTEGIS